MEAKYIQAIELQARWGKWASEDAQHVWQYISRITEASGGEPQFMDALTLYTLCLREGESYFANHAFCDLVNFAKETIPPEMEWQSSWFPTPAGFMVLEDPIQLPKIEAISGRKDNLSVRAIGWLPTNQGSHQVMCYLSFEDYGKEGFGCWSYFVLRNGQKLGDRVSKFEEAVHNAYEEYTEKGVEARRSHEIWWVYTALHLMNEQLAHLHKHEVGRSARRRMARLKVSIPPAIRIVSLKRYEQDKSARSDSGSNREFQWHWMVRGHWRNQYHPSTGKRSPRFIEAYIKGDMSKPLKPVTHTLHLVAGEACKNYGGAGKC